jgi:hypothetical protein
MGKHHMALWRREAADDPDDILWGIDGENGIAAAINRTPAQVYYLIRTGKLQSVVRKIGHKTYSASRSRLREYLAGELSESE